MTYKVLLDGAELNLFPNQEIAVSFEYYDSNTPDNIKLPFSFEEKFPYTAFNKAAIGYNAASKYGVAPSMEKPYELYVDGNLVSTGKAKFVSAVINSAEPYFTLEFTDSVSSFSKSLRDLRFSDIYSDTFSTTDRTLSTYLTVNQDYAGRDIEIPFIDVDNIQKKDGWASRQFTSWGITGKKVGLFPALNVQSFFSRVFAQLNQPVFSKFIDGTSSWTSEDLYVMYPTALGSKTANTRESYLWPFPYNVNNNIDQTTYAPIDVVLGGNSYGLNYTNIENYKLTIRDTYEPFGPTNYDPSAEADLDRGYAYQHRTSSGVTDYGDENIGYTAYASAFDAKVSFTTGNNVNVSGLKYTILSSQVEIGDNVVPTAIQIYTASLPGAEFTPYLDIYGGFTTSSAPDFRIPLLDVSGNPLKLNAASLIQPAVGTIDYPTSFNNVSPGLPINFANTLVFNDFDAFIDESAIYSLNGGTRYSYAISLVMTGGSLTVNHLTTYFQDNNIITTSIATSVELRQSDIIKSRVHGYDWSALGIKLNNAGMVVATDKDDLFNFSDSFSNNESISVYDLFVDLMKRFNLSLIYDYRSTSLGIRLDNLNDLRSATPVYIDSYIDNSKEYEVALSQSSPKTLKLKNKSNRGLYDVFETGNSVGSVEVEFDQYGNGEQTIDFITSLINPIDKSVCSSEDFYNDPIRVRDGLISLPESGQIKNAIQNYEDIGLRIFYLEPMSSALTLRYPKWVRKNQYGQTVDENCYKSVGNIKLQGYPVVVNENSNDLRFATKTGTLLDAYTYITNSEKYKSAYSTSITFYAAFPIHYFEDGYFFNKKFRIDDTQENLIMISFTDARLYNEYVYGKVEAIFVD